MKLTLSETEEPKDVICSFLIMCIASIPLSVRVAVRKDWNPNMGVFAQRLEKVEYRIFRYLYPIAHPP
jgi:hypothetical protein